MVMRRPGEIRADDPLWFVGQSEPVRLAERRRRRAKARLLRPARWRKVPDPVKAELALGMWRAALEAEAAAQVAKRRAVAALVLANMSRVSIARELGIGKTSVDRYVAQARGKQPLPKKT